MADSELHRKGSEIRRTLLGDKYMIAAREVFAEVATEA
jgi:hypothetical protein